MIQTEKSHLPVAAITHPGMKGKVNEDRFGVTAFRVGRKNHTPSLLTVLSDGIGGHRAGEVASEMVVNLISQQILESDGSNPTRALQEAVKFASENIFSASQNNPNYTGMGATCACAWVIGRQLFAATVGDSRIYLMRGARIYQLSTDHTWIQEALEAGLIKKEDAAGHPNAHIIRRYLGSVQPPTVDLRLRLGHKERDTQAMSNQGMPLRSGDGLVLCSDGLTDLVSDEEIHATLRKYPQEDGIQRLVDLANSRGGYDNITLLSVQVPELKPAAKVWRRLAISFGVMLTFAVLAGTLAGAWLWYNGTGNQSGSPSGPFQSVFAPFLPFRLNNPTSQPSTEPTIQPKALEALPTTTPARPILPPFQPAGGGPTLTPWPTNTLAPTRTSLATQAPATPQA